MNTLDNSRPWAPSDAEMAQIERQVRGERAKAARDAFRFVRRRIANALLGERAADKVRVGGRHAHC